MDSLELKLPKYMVFCVIIACLEAFSNGYSTGATNVPGTVTHACEYGDAKVHSGGLPDCLPMNTALW
jgi:hypothetical protein